MANSLWHVWPMPKRSRNTQPDVNQLAAAIVASLVDVPASPITPEGKNPAAVALGRLGGLKGGRARANKLSSNKRAEIAKKAAKARWANKK